MADPLHQFEIVPVKFLPPLEIAGYDISFTNSALWMLIATVLSVSILTIGMRKKSMVPTRMQALSEMMYEFVANMIRENIGTKGRIYFPLIFTTFIMVLFGNLLGMIPYSFTYTSHIIVTMALALFIFAIVIVVGIIRNGTQFFTLFAPAGVPIVLQFLIVPLEIISFLARPLTLSVRLFANMMAGHLILKVFAGFSVAMLSLGTAGFFAGLVPMFMNVILIGFEILIALLHAYVFTILSCIYLKDTVDLHH